MTWPTGGPEKNNDGNKRRLNLLQATENSGPSRNYGKKQLGSHQEKLNPYEENPITERNGDMSKLDLFFP